jgi:hypothetical protein
MPFIICVSFFQNVGMDGADVKQEKIGMFK